MVPKGWSVFRLEDIVIRTQLGTTERGMSEDPLTTLIPLIKMGNLGWGSVNFNKVEYIEQSLINDSFLLKKGDFLFNTRNTPDLVGKSAVWDEDYTATFDNNINRIVFNKKVYTNFIAYYLNTGKGKSAIQSLPAGSTSVAAIYWKDLKNIQLLLPSLGEQQKIVQILSTWDKAISVTEKLLTNSQQQKKALMQQLLTGKKRLLDENGVRFSGEWVHGQLGDLCAFKGGFAFKEVYQGQSMGELPFIKVSDMNLLGNERNIEYSNNWVSFETAKLMKAKPFPESSIVFAKVGAALLLNRRRILLRPTIIDNNMMAAVPSNAADTEFLYQLLMAIDFARFVQEGAVPSINQGDLSSFKLSYPYVEEQQKIAAVLSAADAEISTLEKKLACLKDEKKALMQQLLTGKRRVKVDAEEAVSA
ncbi:restriction endonuclease subunit S [Escherichia coli]|uniref:restriction endonuclease subunit S n=1 Tax=Escherichia coli TaxID=562 RepID=UPI001C5B066E|nr:restriction endonuclease subunit S [Escherichia coli]MBW4285029.1 restriction endonuclease subunit S [Escherichia coli]